MHFNRIFAVLMGAMIAAGAAAPAFAQTPSAGACAVLTLVADKVDQEVVRRKGKLNEARVLWNAAVSKGVQDYDSKVAAARSQADAERNAHYVKLEARATTDAQKAAVAEFKTSIEAAVSARQSAVNAAAIVFRQGLSSIADSRRAKINAAVDAYEAAIRAAFNKAEADCSAAVNSQQITADLRAALRAGHDKFIADLRAIERFSAQVQPLLDARKVAFEKAADDFKNAARAAADKLRVAFGGV